MESGLDYGDHINELKRQILAYPRSARRQASWDSTQRYQQRIDQAGYRLASLTRGLVDARARYRQVSQEVRGLERTLEAIDREARGDLAPAVSARLAGRRTLEAELAEEVAAEERRLRTHRVDLRGLRVSLASSLGDALEEVRLAHLRSRPTAGSGKRVVIADDEEQFWSPSPIIGYRVWSVGGDGLYGARAKWSTPRYVASCRRGAEVPHSDGRCANVAFGCGVYAAKSIQDLLNAQGVGRNTPFVAASVALSGKVIEHEHGYRAAVAEVTAAVFNGEDGLFCSADSTAIDDLFHTRATHGMQKLRTTETSIDRCVANALTDLTRKDEPWT